MANLCVCMIAHNEELNIARSIGSVTGWAARIVVVDTESDDRTAEIARSLGARVLSHPNRLNFNSIKNVAFAAAGTEWIFSLDADEVVPEDLKREIAETIARAPAENGFKMPRRNFYFGVPLKHGGNYPDNQLRVFRRGTGKFPENGPHERMTLDGAVGSLTNYFDHHPYPTLDVWLRKFMLYTADEAAAYLKKNIPITSGTIRRYMIARPMRRWLSRLFVKRGIRDGVPGVLAATFDLMTQTVGFGRYWMEIRRREQNS